MSVAAVMRPEMGNRYPSTIVFVRDQTSNPREPTTPRATTAAAAADRPAKQRQSGGQQTGNDEWGRAGGVRSSPSPTRRLMGEAMRGGDRQIKYPETKRRAGRERRVGEAGRCPIESE
ncbi:hypothetical protein PGTUg99_000260 [Puccinia graminis f. sp. tritici]|uniref:Uncharacterized protein n=1 Tax=Puccinia graminis f. sp. tritici TaxID=56615 RepID=A0A5B0NDK8_PUCGR|nr:hypothetical protein PGTUg99_000260 [Puccinia graminis f. sp. tritici]